MRRPVRCIVLAKGGSNRATAGSIFDKNEAGMIISEQIYLSIDESIEMKTPIALITGVSRGLGFELTREYCRLGWRVFGVFRNEADGSRLSSSFGEAFVAIRADLREDSAVKKIRFSLEKQTDYLSLLINNAGIAGTGHSIEKTSCSEIKELVEVHCCGAIRCLQATLPFLRKAELPF